MTGSPPSAVAETPRSDPSQDPAAGACAAAGRLGRALGVVRKLIEYGRHLAGTLKQGSTAVNLMVITSCFSTDDVAEILARIARALHLAAALEDKLLGYAGPPERELPKARLPWNCRPRAVVPVGPKAQPGVVAAQAASTLAPCAAGADDSASPAAQEDDRSGPARMPTAEEIAHRLRSRPIGAIVADICFDLGIQPSHPLWDELYVVIVDNGGNPCGLFMRDLKQQGIFFKQSLAKRGITGQTRLRPPPPPPGWMEPPAEARGTGPP